MESYHPTLWRTCRTLANAKRILCLRAVLTAPSSTVREIAVSIGNAENHTGECLRALQARGLIQARRQSRWVRYVPVPNPLVASARPLLAALRKTLLKENRAEAAVIRVLTAYTHPRRLTILYHLQSTGSASFDALAALGRISPPALYRHLNKLKVRGLVFAEAEKWHLAPVRDPLAKVLLLLLAKGES